MFIFATDMIQGLELNILFHSLNIHH